MPGVNAKGAYFTRGSGHNRFGQYTEDSAEYQEVLDRLSRKFATAKTLVPPAILVGPGSRDAGILSIGSCDGAITEALGVLAERGIRLDYLRVLAFPFGTEVEDFLSRHSIVYVVEQNRDAQLRSLLTLETAVEKSKLRSILHYDGMPLAANFIVRAIEDALGTGERRTAASN